jgi:hypothetical protein
MRQYPSNSGLPVSYFLKSAAFVKAKIDEILPIKFEETDLDLLISIVPSHAVELKRTGAKTSLLDFVHNLNDNYLDEPSSIIVVNYETLYRLAAEAGGIDYKETLCLPYSRSQLGRL